MKRNKAHRPPAGKPQNVAQPLATAIELQRQGKVVEAESLLRQVLRTAPTNAAALYSLAVILLNSGRIDEALVHATTASEANPHFAEPWFIRAAVLQVLNRREEALACYDKALAVNPRYIDALSRSGTLLHDLHRDEQAVDRFRRVLDLDPDHQTALSNYGILLSHFKQGEQAAAVFERLVRNNPDYPYALALLCNERIRQCDWGGLEATTQRILSGIREGRKTCKPLIGMALSDLAGDHLRCAEIFADAQYPVRPAPLWNGERYDHARVRIAYVSPDFREHPVGHLMAGVIEAHDRSRIETIGISLGPDDGSRLYARLAAAFEHFVDAKDMHPRQIAELMRQMEVDIAVDLAGYTTGAHPEIFLNRPAPIQVNYLGYPGTMGLDCYDYLIADRTVIPGEHLAFYREKVLWLDHCYLPIASGVEPAEPQPRSAYGLPEQALVFCAFGHDYKIHPQMFAVWMRLLAANPGSVLWLTSRSDLSAANLRREAQHHGIDPDRLVIATRLPQVEDHLARYRVADLFLDTWPYNAHTTAADALLAGLPVVTCQGNAFPARVASSLLETLGLGELITHSFDQYFELANALAHDPHRRQALRQGISATLAHGDHPLLGRSFARSLEKVFMDLAGPLPNQPPIPPAQQQAVPRRLVGAEHKPVAILVPIYQAELSVLERYSLARSLAALNGRDIYFIGPQGLDLRQYTALHGAAPFIDFDPATFASRAGYSRLLLSRAFYEQFSDYEFVLILQTDAVILRDDLDFWCRQPFDYVGAPWPDGVELFINAGKFAGAYGKRLTVYVGNGGLSLRRVRKCIALLDEFADITDLFQTSGSSEDLFFAFMGALSTDFVIPNEIIASRFAMEVKPSFYQALNGHAAPMGGHAWWKYEPQFWRSHLPDIPLPPATTDVTESVSRRFYLRLP